MKNPLHLEAWREPLLHRGFTPSPEGLVRDGLVFRWLGRWAWFEHQPANPPPDCLTTDTGKSGLWRWVATDALPRRVFEVPGELLTEDAADDVVGGDGGPPVEQILAWAETTAPGTGPSGWQPPARSQLESILPPRALTLQIEAQVRQGELLHGTGRLALRFPVLLAVPPELPEPRLRWLRALLLDAQRHARMVRLGFLTDGETTSVVAETDLTGAPHWACERLILAGLDGLRWVVAGLAESAEFLADAGITSRALELCAVHEPTQHRKEEP